MADKTGIVFEIDPRSAEQGEKRIVKSLNSIRAAAEKTALLAGKSLDTLAYNLDLLSLVKGPSATMVKNLAGMNAALKGFRAPSEATIMNTVSLVRHLSSLPGPSSSMARNMSALASSLGSFKVPTTTQVRNLEYLLTTLANAKVNSAALKELGAAIGAILPKVSSLNSHMSALAANSRIVSPNLNRIATAMSKTGTVAHNTGGRTHQLGNNFRVLSSQSLSLSAALLRTRVAFEALFAVFAMKEIYSINVSFQKMEAGIRAVSGSAESAAEQMEFIRQVSNRLGLDVTQVGEGFTRFLGSLQGTTMTVNEAQKVFYGLSQAARVLHLDAQDQEGIFKALGQIMSKGSLQAEELRGQLGDRMPAAFAVMAIAMGKTTAELGVLMKKGQVTGQVLKEAMINFSVEYKKMTAAGLDQSVNGLQAAMGRLGNAFKYLVKDFGEGGFNDVIKVLAEDFTDWMNSMRESGRIKVLAGYLREIATTIASVDFSKWIMDALYLTAAIKGLSAANSLLSISSVAVVGNAAAISTAFVGLTSKVLGFSMLVQSGGVFFALSQALSAVALATAPLALVFATWTAVVVGSAAAIYKLIQLTRDWLNIGRELTYNDEVLIETTEKLNRVRKEAADTLKNLASGQEQINLFTVEDIALRKDQAYSEYVRLKSLRDLMQASTDMLKVQASQNKATKDQLEWLARSESTLKTLNTQVDIASQAVNDLGVSQKAAITAQPWLDVLDQARTYGTLLGEVNAEQAKMLGQGVAAEDLYKKIKNEVVQAALGMGVLSQDTLDLLNRLQGKNAEATKASSASSPTEGINKLASALKTLNTEIDKITIGESFGNVDRLVSLNEKVEEYQKALGSAKISSEQLAKVELARRKILQDLTKDLKEYVQDQQFSNAQLSIDIQQTIDEQNGLESSKRAQNDLTAAIDLCNLAREEEATLRQMNMSLSVAERTGNLDQIAEIRDTIELIKKNYEERRKGIKILQQERNTLDSISQELKGPVAEGFKSVAEAMKDGMSSAIEAMISGTKGGFSNLWKSIKDSFVKGLASLIATAYANPIIIYVLQTAGSAVGMQTGTINSVLNSTFGQGSSSMGVGGSSGLGSIGSLFGNSSSMTSAFDQVGSLFGIGGVGPAANGGVSGGLSSYSSFTNGSFGGSLGAGLGSIGGSFLASKILGSKGAGAQIGGTIGGIAGSFIPVPILGPMIGSFVGTAIGGLFGNKKPTNAAAFGSLDFGSGVASYSHMNKGNSAENMKTLQTAFDQVMTFSQNFNNLGVGKISGSITGIDAGVRDRQTAYVNGTKVTAEAGQFGQLAINALKEALNQTAIGNSDVRTAIANTDFTDLSKALADMNFAAHFQDTLKAYKSEYTAEIELKKQATESAANLTEQLTTFVDTTRRLGLSVSDASNATKTYVDNLVSGAEQNTYTELEIAVKTLRAQWDAMTPVLQAVGYTADQAAKKIQEGFTNNLAKMTASFNADIASQILAITDPTGYALSQLDTEFDTIRKNAIAVGADLAAVEKLYGLKRTQILEDSLKAAGTSLRDWLNSQLLGSTSTLTPSQKLMEAQSQFGSQLSLARLGDKTALSNITGSADVLLKTAQDYYASSPEYSNLVTFVRASLENLGSQLNLSGFPDNSDTIAQLIALREEAGKDSAATRAELNAILTQIEELNRRLLSMSITSGGRAA